VKESKLNKEEISNIVQEGFPVYESREALEEARLREAVNRTDTEKFRLFTTMMRINMMMKRAKITYQPE
jgi:hypothetical protein